MCNHYKATENSYFRIHVERYNQRLKLYDFIGNIIAHHKLPIINDAIFVCANLVNFTRIFAK